MLLRLTHFLAAFGFGLLFGSPASAWNGTGHKAVALIACFELKEDQKNAMADLLKSHPHTNIAVKGGVNFFTSERPPNIDEVQWAILRAATWPDFVRPPRFTTMTKEQIASHEIFKYHRPDQHFIDQAFGDLALIKANQKAPAGLNILQALDKAEGDLKNMALPNGDRAIALCWLLHLIGDIHQPLHCSTFFSKEFPKGDIGGNAFSIGSTNLHSFWDELLGGEEVPFDHLDSVAVTIHRAPELQRAKLNELKTAGYPAWAAESSQLAQMVAYRSGKLQGINKEHGHDDGPFVVPPFPDGYRQQAELVARRRIALAGYRLADKLAGFFPTGTRK